MWMQKLDVRVSRKSNVLLILGLLGIALMMFHTEFNYDPVTRTIDGNSKLGLTLKFVIGFTTIALLSALFDYYQLQVYIWRKYGKESTGQQVIFRLQNQS